MKRLRTTISAVVALGLMTIAASAARADTFACVNKSSGGLKIVASCSVGTNASPCHNNDVCVNLSAGSAGLGLAVVCETETAPAEGGFNIDALCSAGQVVVSGGYQCTDSNGDLLSVTVQENTFHFSNVTPDGWQVIGLNPNGVDGSCRVCATCTTGSAL